MGLEEVKYSIVGGVKGGLVLFWLWCWIPNTSQKLRWVELVLIWTGTEDELPRASGSESDGDPDDVLAVPDGPGIMVGTAGSITVPLESCRDVGLVVWFGLTGRCELGRKVLGHVDRNFVESLEGKLVAFKLGGGHSAGGEPCRTVS